MFILRHATQVAVASLAVLACIASSPAALAEAPRQKIIRDVAIVDVEAGRIVRGRDVLIDGERIASILPAGRPGMGAEGQVVIDGAGLYLMPGLFDAHVHLSADPEAYPPMLVAHGVTCVRDTGAATEMILDLRRRAAAGEILSPEIIATGAIIDGSPPVWPFSEACDTPEEARDAVRRLAEAGVDQIKVYSLLKPDVYAAAVEEAKRRGLTVTGHVPGSMTLQEAIRAGQDCIEHLDGIAGLIRELAGDGDGRGGMFGPMTGWFQLDEVDRDELREALRPIAESGVMQCPTIVVISGIGSIAGGDALDDPRMRYISHSSRQFWTGPQYENFSRTAAEMVAPMLEVLGELHALGAPLMIGSDLANAFVFPGSSVHEEMAMFARAGVPAPDILRAATIVPARFCAVDDRLGTVEVGKVASLALVRGNPLDDITHAAEIEAVFLRGEYFDRAALDEMMEDVARLVESTEPTGDDDDLIGPLRDLAIHHGVYTLRYEQWDAGTEEFAIVRSQDGASTIHAHLRPVGGAQSPTYITTELDADGGFRRATWRQLTQVPVEAEYVVEDGAVIARAARDGEPLPEQRTPLPDRHFISPPTYIADYFVLPALGLAPGETRELQAAGFGFPDWRIALTPTTITREEDRRPPNADEAAPPAHVYMSVSTLPIGEFHATVWTDRETHLPLHIELRMPFGTIVATLER